MPFQTIPNGFVLSVIAAFYAHALVSGMPISLIVEHTGIAIVFLVLLAIAGHYLGMGMGAVKLLSAGVLWFGYELGLAFLLLSWLSHGLLGGVFATIQREYSGKVPMLPFAAVSALIVGHFGNVFRHIV